MNMQQLVFRHRDVISLQDMLNNLYCLRNWPMLESPEVLEQIVRAGVQKVFGASSVWEEVQATGPRSSITKRMRCR